MPLMKILQGWLGCFCRLCVVAQQSFVFALTLSEIDAEACLKASLADVLSSQASSLTLFADILKPLSMILFEATGTQSKPSLLGSFWRDIPSSWVMYRFLSLSFLKVRFERWWDSNHSFIGIKSATWHVEGIPGSPLNNDYIDYRSKLGFASYRLNRSFWRTPS